MLSVAFQRSEGTNIKTEAEHIEPAQLKSKTIYCGGGLTRRESEWADGGAGGQNKIAKGFILDNMTFF